MSSFEIAGIVLGSIPLVIAGLSHYKAGNTTMALISNAKTRGYLRHLILRLEKIKYDFHIDLSCLIQYAAIEDYKRGVDLTETECIAILKDPKKEARLLRFLGQHEAYFRTTMARLEEYLKVIISKMRHLQRLPNVRSLRHQYHEI